MSLAPYRHLLTDPRMRHLVLLGMLIRTPMWAANMLVTLHVVTSLGRSYSEAGLATLVTTVAAAIAGPIRGRRLDRIGLRRTLVPCLVAAAIAWGAAPFVPFWAFVVLVGFAGYFMIPIFPVVRQGMLALVGVEQRRVALSLDSVATEATFMIGPLLGVWLGTTVPTAYALLGCQAAVIVLCVGLWWVNPRLTREATVTDQAPQPWREWFTPAVVALLVLTAVTTVILTGTDLGLVALLREAEATPSLGVIMMLWGLGSLIGGLVYGGLHRRIPAWHLVLALGLVTIPVGVSHALPVVGILAAVAGLLCAPAITATVEQLSHLVGERNRGEALGWHGSFMMGGSALGAPLAGAAIDHSAAMWGFVVVGVLGAAAALLGGVVLRVRHRRGILIPVPVPVRPDASGDPDARLAPVGPAAE